MKKMNKKGFTLVEMLVVIAIIAILVAILVPTVLGATKKAKASTDAANLRSELAAFQIEYLTEGKTEPTEGTTTVGDYKCTAVATDGTQTWTKTGATASKLDGCTIIKITISDSSSNAAYYSNDTTKKGDIAYYAAIADGTGS